MMKAAKKYCRKVARLLPCSRKTKKSIMSQLIDNVDMFADANPNVDYAAIVQQFGEPKYVAGSVVESTGTAEVLSAFYCRRRITTAIIAVIVSALLIFSWSVLYLYREAQNSIISVIEISPAQKATSTDIP